ncbi:unnamed protein product [Mytilus edulis]|uniref:FLYWCH-type domain-containing protein n=1 Tax=Mytilus edulis TaxID=6550 RepID=A0A8S3UIX8_MYTED|nr:unnamed protein product [Mytilus edulis]
MANAQLDIQFVTNRLGNQSIIHNGYQFRVKTRRDERVYWICTTRNCPATLDTRNNIPTKLPNGHNHDSHKVKLKVDEILQTIKKRCREETTPVPTIYEQEVIKLRNPEWNDETQEIVENLPTFESCRGSFYNERSKLIPALPKTRNEINLAEPWTVTTVGEQFLMADDGLHDRIMMFTTRQNLTHLTAADIIYGDGTFYTCRDVFFQLYTFHAFVDGAIYPLVYALLPGKSQIIYTSMANAQLDIQFVTNRLGNQSIIHNGYQFRVKTRRDERVYWICTTRNCPANIKYCNNIPTKLPNGHNHDSHKVKLKVDEILQTIKKRCREETTPVPTIYEQEVIKLRNPEWNDETQEIVENLPTF